MVPILRRRHWQMCLCIFAIVRIAVVWGRPIVRFPDSIGYERLSFFGDADRFWPVTIVYWVVSNDTARVVAQVGIQILAFSFLATSLVALCSQRLWTGIPVLVLACTPQITRFDLTILSESLGLSYLALALGGGLWVLRKRTRGSVIFSMLALGTLAMSRPPQLILVIIATVIAVATAARIRTRNLALVAIGLVVLSGWGSVQVQRNTPMRTLVFYSMLDNRIVRNPDATAWFVEHGMPLSADSQSYLGYPYPNILTPSPFSSGYVYPTDLSPDLLQYLQLPTGQMPPTLMKTGGFELARWVKSDGWSTYAKFVVTHPGDSLNLMRERADFTLNPPDKYLLPLSPREIIPHVAFGSYQWWILGSLIMLVLTAIFTKWSWNLLFVVGGFLVCFAWFAIVMQTSGIEHSRHAITVAVAIRLLSAISIVHSLHTLIQTNYRRANG